MAEGVGFSRPVKTSYNGFYLATLESLTKDWPGGSYLVLKSTTRVTGDRTQMGIGYKYNYRNVLGFIATEEAGSNEPGDIYLSRYPDIFLIFLFHLCYSSLASQVFHSL